MEQLNHIYKMKQLNSKAMNTKSVVLLHILDTGGLICINQGIPKDNRSPQQFSWSQSRGNSCGNCLSKVPAGRIANNIGHGRSAGQQSGFHVVLILNYDLYCPDG